MIEGKLSSCPDVIQRDRVIVVLRQHRHYHQYHFMCHKLRYTLVVPLTIECLEELQRSSVAYTKCQVLH